MRSSQSEKATRVILDPLGFTWPPAYDDLIPRRVVVNVDTATIGSVGIR